MLSKYVKIKKQVVNPINKEELRKTYKKNLLIKKSLVETKKLAQLLVDDTDDSITDALKQNITLLNKATGKYNHFNHITKYGYTLTYNDPKFCYDISFDGDNEKIVKTKVEYYFEVDDLSCQTLSPMHREGRCISKDALPPMKFLAQDSFKPIHYYREATKQFRKMIKEQKKKVTSKEIETRTFTSNRFGKNYTYTMCGETHTESGAIIELAFAMQAAKVFEPKKPKTQEKHVGIELEFFCTAQKDQLAGKLHKAKLADYVELKTDGSIKNYPPNNYGHELAILCKENEVVEIVNRVGMVLKEVSAQVNSSCGMHMHFDMRNRDCNIVFNNLVKVQSILYLLNPKSRMKNKFCAPAQTTDYKTITERYTGINPTAYQKHKTFEIRIHSGTVNPIKIINWFKIIQKVVEKQEVIKRGFEDLGRFIKHFEFNEELAKYIIARADKHNTHDIDPNLKVMDDSA